MTATVLTMVADYVREFNFYQNRVFSQITFEWFLIDHDIVFVEINYFKKEQEFYITIKKKEVIEDEDCLIACNGTINRYEIFDHLYKVLKERVY